MLGLGFSWTSSTLELQFPEFNGSMYLYNIYFGLEGVALEVLYGAVSIYFLYRYMKPLGSRL